MPTLLKLLGIGALIVFLVAIGLGHQRIWTASLAWKSAALHVLDMASLCDHRGCAQCEGKEMMIGEIAHCFLSGEVI